MVGSYHFKLFGVNNIDDLTHEQYEILIAYEIHKVEQEKKAYETANKNRRFGKTGRTVSIQTKN